MEKVDFGFGAYKQGPAHVIVAADTRREIARCNHKEDLAKIVMALRSHDELVSAVRSAKLDIEYIRDENPGPEFFEVALARLVMALNNVTTINT